MQKFTEDAKFELMEEPFFPEKYAIFARFLTDSYSLKH